MLLWIGLSTLAIAFVAILVVLRVIKHHWRRRESAAPPLYSSILHAAKSLDTFEDGDMQDRLIPEYAPPPLSRNQSAASLKEVFNIRRADVLGEVVQMQDGLSAELRRIQLHGSLGRQHVAFGLGRSDSEIDL
ncbi:hypothetical protein BC830DRAFT_1127754 [Chytriomyces sp. MP71]|nr:hypothetical protein BC830DRAFT_1127754 [Chytriomyces sp. MP71]